MRIYKEESLKDFQFWSGARYLADKLTSNEFDIVEELLEELYPEGMEETEINDFFRFDGDTIAQALGYEDEEDMTEQKEKEERSRARSRTFIRIANAMAEQWG